MNITFVLSSIILFYIQVVRKKTYGKADKSLILVYLISYAIFLFNLGDNKINYYGYIFPFFHLFVSYVGFRLSFKSLERYYIYYNKLEMYLFSFFLSNGIVWILIYFLDLIGIGRTQVEQSIILPIQIIGMLIFVFSVSAALSIFYVNQEYFTPTYKYRSTVENIVLIFFGIIIGGAITEVSNNPVVPIELYNQLIFSFPNPESITIKFGLVMLFVPYLLLIYNARRFRVFIQNTRYEGTIEPSLVTKLIIIETSMYFYIIAAVFYLSLYWLPFYNPDLLFQNGINQLFSIPFIFVLVIALSISFQTPDWVAEQIQLRGKKSFKIPL